MLLHASSGLEMSWYMNRAQGKVISGVDDCEISVCIGVKVFDQLSHNVVSIRRVKPAKCIYDLGQRALHLIDTGVDLGHDGIETLDLGNQLIFVILS